MQQQQRNTDTRCHLEAMAQAHQPSPHCCRQMHSLMHLPATQLTPQMQDLSAQAHAALAADVETSLAVTRSYTSRILRPQIVWNRPLPFLEPGNELFCTVASALSEHALK